jgi:hypothetical protein
MTSERFRPRLRLGAFALVVVVVSGLVAWAVFSGTLVQDRADLSGTSPPPREVPTSQVGLKPVAKVWVPLPAALAGLAATQQVGTQPANRRLASSSPVQAAEPEGEVCGLGNAAAGSAEATALSKLSAERDTAAAARLFALMAQSPDAAVRAAAQLGADQREALAMAAQQTRDPVIYAFARQACSRAGPQPAACAMLSPHRMAALDPQNVVPWLWVAEEATRVGNAQGVEEAVYRASLATESRLREYAFAVFALSSIPADWPTWDAVFASAQVLQIHAALSLPSYLPMVKVCSAERTRDANVRQTCDRLAQVLVEKGDTLVDHGIGRRLGERAGWPADKVELLNARRAAYTKASLDGDTLASGSGHGPCGQLVRNVQLALAHARDGERAYAQARLAESGTTDADMLLQYRKGRAASAPR